VKGGGGRAEKGSEIVSVLREQKKDTTKMARTCRREESQKYTLLVSKDTWFEKKAARWVEKVKGGRARRRNYRKKKKKKKKRKKKLLPQHTGFRADWVKLKGDISKGEGWRCQQQTRQTKSSAGGDKKIKKIDVPGESKGGRRAITDVKKGKRRKMCRCQENAVY